MPFDLGQIDLETCRLFAVVSLTVVVVLWRLYLRRTDQLIEWLAAAVDAQRAVNQGDSQG